MSAFSNYCLAYEELAGSIYPFEDTVIMNIDNEGHDRVSLTLNPIQALAIAKGLQNVIAQMPVQTDNSGLLHGNMTLKYPIDEDAQSTTEPQATIENPILYLEKERPVA